MYLNVPAIIELAQFTTSFCMLSASMDFPPEFELTRVKRISLLLDTCYDTEVLSEDRSWLVVQYTIKGLKDSGVTVV